jgi:molybdenum cofactor cytidylyltransferase
MGKGEGPKQMLEAGGKPLLAWTLEAALKSELAEVILVLGYEAERIQAALGPLAMHPRLKIVENARYREGMASSLQTGLQEVKNRFPSVMFLLGDQPLLGAETINLLLARFREADKGICVPVWGRRRGNPVIFARRYYDEVLAVRGDRGAREIIDAHPRDILPVAINDPRCFLDLDSAADARQLLPLLGKDKS